MNLYCRISRPGVFFFPSPTLKKLYIKREILLQNRGEGTCIVWLFVPDETCKGFLYRLMLSNDGVQSREDTRGVNRDTPKHLTGFSQDFRWLSASCVFSKKTKQMVSSSLFYVECSLLLSSSLLIFYGRLNRAAVQFPHQYPPAQHFNLVTTKGYGTTRKKERKKTKIRSR